MFDVCPDCNSGNTSHHDSQWSPDDKRFYWLRMCGDCGAHYRVVYFATWVEVRRQTASGNYWEQITPLGKQEHNNETKEVPGP